MCASWIQAHRWVFLLDRVVSSERTSPVCCLEWDRDNNPAAGVLSVACHLICLLCFLSLKCKVPPIQFLQNLLCPHLLPVGWRYLPSYWYSRGHLGDWLLLIQTLFKDSSYPSPSETLETPIPKAFWVSSAQIVMFPVSMPLLRHRV